MSPLSKFMSYMCLLDKSSSWDVTLYPFVAQGHAYPASDLSAMSVPADDVVTLLNLRSRSQAIMFHRSIFSQVYVPLGQVSYVELYVICQLQQGSRYPSLTSMHGLDKPATYFHSWQGNRDIFSCCDASGCRGWRNYPDGVEHNFSHCRYRTRDARTSCDLCLVTYNLYVMTDDTTCDMTNHVTSINRCF